MHSSPHPHPLKQSKITDQQLTASFLDTSSFPRPNNLSLPCQSLQESMSKFQRQARDQLLLSHLVQQLASTLQEMIQNIMQEKIHKEITRVVNQVLCIREEVNLFAKEGQGRQEEGYQLIKGEMRRLKKRVDELSARGSNITFQNCLQESKGKSLGQTGGGGVQGVVRDVYQFMQKNDPTKLLQEYQLKFQRIQQQLQHQSQTLSQKIQQATKKQKPINQNLRKQISDAISKEAIGKEVKRCLKENIRYLFDELVRSRKDIEVLRAELNTLNERQRELEFSQTLLEHKIA